MLPLLLAVILPLAVLACPDACTCSGGTVTCVGKQLTKIPSGIPDDTQRLDLQENRISVIRRDDIANLQHLKILQLMDNHIHIIEDGAFDNLLSLERLRLNRNRLRSLPEHIFKQNKQLHRLDLSENYLSTLTDDQLRGPIAMRNLQLDKNSLICLETGTISQWSSLEVLTLNSNNLTTIAELDAMPNLRLFRLAENPLLCDCRLKWMKRSLSGQASAHAKCAKPAILHGLTLADVDESKMKCSGIEKRATASCKDARVCPPSCTCTETTVDCRDRGLTHIPANLPPSTSELRLEQNQITYVPPRAFENMKNLKRLDLSKNSIVEISPKAFEGLDSLNSLVIYGNNLTELPVDAFTGLHNLQLLLLNANQLQCIRRGTFEPLKSLNLLSLYDNQIKSISEETFKNLTRLQTLHLAKNPLICDCNLEWLARLNTVKNLETSGARCEYPKRLARKRFSALTLNKFRCKGAEGFITQNADQCFIDYTCPEKCNCHGTTVDCSDNQFSSVPEEIPVYTKHLILSRNKIKNLEGSSSLQMLTNLQKLDLSNNLIGILQDGIFSKMTKLEELNLSNNKLRHFSSASLGRNSSLRVLWLNKNNLVSISNITLSRLSHLQSLSNNKIQCFTSTALDGLSSLKNIDIGGNDLPCDCRVSTLVRWARKDSSRIVESEICQSTGKPITKLMDIDLICSDRRNEMCVDGGDHCPLGCSCQNNVVRCSNKKLTEFPIGIPADTEELFLDSNSIQKIPIDQLTRLTQLVKLDLSHNQIVSIEDDTFLNLTKLSTLIISYNKLRCLQPRAFSGLSALRILSLHGNDISMLPESAFADMGNITHLAVGSNSLYCDCKMAWFSRWIKAKFVESGIARCEGPETVSNQLILTSSPSNFVCSSATPQKVLAKCNACVENPCKNKAECSPVGGSDYTCSCPAGYHGKNCQHQIDACFGHPCMNNATCKVIQAGRFACVCPKGFNGDYCQQNIDDCVDNKCQNGGQCVDQVNNYRCHCPVRFTGKFCEKKVEYCTPLLNPCENNGKCQRNGTSYICTCLPGFTGTNCTTNIDDCGDHMCKNGAICVDGITTYSCKCAQGFTGQFCDVPTSTNALYLNTDSCQASSCGHGSCHFDEESGEYGCRCHEGFVGRQCDRQISIGFHKRNSYIALEPWNIENGNLTLHLLTTNRTGLIAYYGDEHFISAELYDGRIKIAFYVGNHIASHMYSFFTVNDGLRHRIEILIQGKKCQMKIDSNAPQTVENDGKNDEMKVETKQLLYFGGISQKKAEIAMQKFHIREDDSMKGCISNVYLNDKLVDFTDHVDKKDVTEGCSDVVDLCAGVECGHGICSNNATASSGYTCNCQQGYTGEYCNKREITCNKEKFRKIHIEDDCRSVEEIKNASCNGYCGDGEECCHAVKTKRRRVKMHCKDGSTRISMVNIVRKCQCVNSCPARDYVKLLR